MATFEKFGKNIAGIKNSHGQELTLAYIRRYCECWCRLEHGYKAKDRKAIFDEYTSDAYLLAHANLTGSQIGGKCAEDPRWECNAKKTPATVVTNGVMTPAAPTLQSVVASTPYDPANLVSNALAGKKATK